MKKIFAIIVNFQQKRRTLDLREKLTKQQGNFKLTTIVIDNSEKNIGFAAAVNKGIKVALYKKSDFVLLLNPDIKIPENLISNLLKTRGDITGPVIKYKKNGQWVYDLGGKVDWRWGRTVHNEISNFSREAGSRFARQFPISKNKRPNYLSGCCLLINKKVFEKIGLLDERFFMYFEDVDFCIRAKEAGIKIKQSRGTIIEHKPSSHIYQNLRSNLLFKLKYQKGWRLLTSLIYFCALCVKVLLNKIFYD